MRTHHLTRTLLVAALLLAVGPGLRPALSDNMLPGPVATGGSPFLLRRTDVRAVVTGPVAHVAVVQRWENPNTFPVDGLYIFPLPENAAVTDMSLRIGERVIRGEMRRREEARAIYEQARREGRVAGLLDQERPNVFAQRVANLMPRMEVEVTLEFDQPIDCEEGSCGYVFPTVVGPRFVPCSQANPGLINPPVVPPGRSTGQRLSLTVELDTGVPARDIESPSHRVSITRPGPARARVVLTEGPESVLNRDFRLRWRVGAGSPEVGLLCWRDPRRDDQPGVFSLILQPPAPDAASLRAGDAPARELVFVLDCSGSMSGVPIEAAKNVVRRSLRALRPQDTFQIIRFSERASGLGPRPLGPTPDNLRAANAYLDSLHGQGGTQMIEGIRAALDRPADPERLRIVAFLTDGYIGNESEILGEVRRLLGGARLFSFGIGSAVNRYLLEGLAEEGRGEAAFLGPRESPEEMVDRFVKRIATPVLTDIELTWEDVEVADLEPASIPDLFAGQPLVIHGRYRTPGTGLLRVEGRRGGLPVTLRHVVIFPDEADDNEALGRLWARARIHRLSREMHRGEHDDLREAIVSLGLSHRLMTPWTSLVAVDRIVSNSTGSSTPVDVPVELPEDVSYEGIFGGNGVARASNSKMKVGRILSMAAPPPIGSREQRSWQDVSTRPSAGTRPGGQSDATAFIHLTLVETDGTRIVIEDDGEVWRLEGRARRLVRALTAAQLAGIREALGLTPPEAWTEGTTEGRRLELESSAGWTRAIRLPSGIEAVDRLARMIRSAAA